MTLGKGGFQVKTVQTEESVRFDNEKMLEDYRKEAESLRNQIAELNRELSNIEETYKSQYAERIKKLEKQEEVAKSLLLHNDAITRDYEKSVADLENMKEEFAKEQEQSRAETLELIKHNDSLIADIEFKTKQLNEAIAKNQNLLDLAESTSAQIDEKSKALDLKVQSHNTQDLIDRKMAEAEKIRDEAQASKVKIEEGFLALHQKEDEINALIKKSKDLSAQALQDMNDLEIKKEEYAQIIKVSDDKIKQIVSEKEANNQILTAIKAKEKLLNEKDIALKEREKNVKILESQQPQGDGNG